MCVCVCISLSVVCVGVCGYIKFLLKCTFGGFPVDRVYIFLLQYGSID